MSEIDEKLRADLADWYEMSRGGTVQPDAKEHLDYLMIEHGIPRRSPDADVGVSEGNLDDKLEEIREGRQEMIDGGVMSLVNLMPFDVYDEHVGWLLNYIDMLRAELQRCKDGKVKRLSPMGALERLRRDAGNELPVLPPPPPITFKPDIVERPGAPYGKREW